jgi:hypothetical protein
VNRLEPLEAFNIPVPVKAFAIAEELQLHSHPELKARHDNGYRS